MSQLLSPRTTPSSRHDNRTLEFSPTILIADDAPDGRALLERALRDAPYRLVFATNGREAVDIFASRHVALVILDGDMPVMNGYDAAHAIRRLPEGARVPIVAVTGYSNGSAIAACAEAGFTTHLTKPVDPQRLQRVIAELLGSKAPLSSARTSDDAEVRWGAHAAAHSPAGYPRGHEPTPRHIADLVPGFLANRRVDAQRIRTLAEAGDLEEVRRLGHNMKSSGTGFGFEAVSVVGRELERAVDALDRNRIRDLADGLEMYLEQIA